MEVENLVVVSDLHCGCRLGLCPPEGVELDDGGRYMPSSFQQALWDGWTEFWDKFVPDATRGERFGVVINGDALDGVHHKATTQVSQNLSDQALIAETVLAPIVDKCEGAFYMIRGTEAHVGQSGAEEERLARSLGAKPSADGQYARYELWKGVGPKLVHLLHHIGTTGSQAYEATAVHKELTESYVEAARWGERPPDVIVRSHRHRYISTAVATGRGHAIAVVTPGWQGKTPFAWKIPGARLAPPQFGGVVIRYGHGEVFALPKVWSVGRTQPE